MFSEDDVKKIARLSYLSLTADELKSLPAELSSILEYVKQLQNVDVSSVEPMSHVHGSKNVFRDDKVETSMPTEDGLSNAPDRSGRFFRVPIIIDQGEN